LTDNGICSRNLEKKLDQKIVSGYQDTAGNKLRKHYDREAGDKPLIVTIWAEFVLLCVSMILIV